MNNNRNNTKSFLSVAGHREKARANQNYTLFRTLPSREKGCTIVRVRSCHRESTYLLSRWYFKKEER